MKVRIFNGGSINAKAGFLALKPDCDGDAALFIVDENGKELVKLGYWDSEGDLNANCLDEEEKEIAIASGLNVGDDDAITVV